MALFQCNFFSHSINIATNMHVIYPELPAKKNYPTLYLLHGYTNNYTSWVRKTSIDRYASQYELAIVMPDVQKSFYCDYPDVETGYKYWAFVSEELISISRKFFHLSDKREDTFVAGLSMGGFGALKLALNRPDVFSAGASLSGAVDMETVLHDSTHTNEVKMIIKDHSDFPGSINDLFYQAQKLNATDVKPRLYQCCGTEDFLYADNVRFRELMKGLNFDYTYNEGPGTHEWGYWDAQIQKVLEWLPLKKTVAAI